MASQTGALKDETNVWRDYALATHRPKNLITVLFRATTVLESV
jgi:hypothetical protein